MTIKSFSGVAFARATRWLGRDCEEIVGSIDMERSTWRVGESYEFEGEKRPCSGRFYLTSDQGSFGFNWPKNANGEPIWFFDGSPRDIEGKTVKISLEAGRYIRGQILD